MSHETPPETWTDRLRRRAVALDLVAVVGYVAVAVLALPDLYGTPAAVAAGLPLLFFVPGYVLVSLLFPCAPSDDVDDQQFGWSRQYGLTASERLALGFGLSVALLPVLGLSLSFSPWAITPTSVLLSVGALTTACAIGAAIRRLRRPPERRFTVPVRSWIEEARWRLSDRSLSANAINVGLAAAVVFAVAAIGFSVAAPGPGQQYTSVALLSHNETGELVADDYPRNFTRGESKSLVVSVTNNEGERVNYSVVVQLQRVRKGDDGGATVLEDRHLATFTPTVAPGQTWRTTHEVTPTMIGDNLRLVYLVYRGDPPAEPTTENAYRYVHVWVNVTASR